MKYDFDESEYDTTFVTGGVGARMKNIDKPKQFLELDGKPIIIHTIDKFEECSMIDAISIACKKEYIDYTKKLILNFGIKKVKWIVLGGETGQLSIFNALDIVHKDETVEEDAIFGKRKGNIKKYSALSVKQIGELFNMDYGVVS